MTATTFKAESKKLYRQSQTRQLSLYFDTRLPSPPILVAHGIEQVDKVSPLLSVLQDQRVDYVLVKSKECLSQRHLLSKIFTASVRKLGQIDVIDEYDRIDSINSLVVNLRRLLQSALEDGKKFVIVIDGIDKQKGTSTTLLPSLARLGNLIPRLSVILTSSSSRPLPLQKSGVPYIHFPPYTKQEAIAIVLASPPPLQPESPPEDFPAISEATLLSIYTSFVYTIYDTLIAHTSSTSLTIFRRACEKLWPRFVWPLLSDESVTTGRQSYQNNAANKTTPIWDFSRLLLRNRSLFQAEGEKALLSQLLMKDSTLWTFDDLLNQHKQNQQASQQPVSDSTPPPSSASNSIFSSRRTRLSSVITNSTNLQQPQFTSQVTTLLKPYPTLLLLSSYLASHTAPKHDIILFSRLSSSSSHKRKYLASALQKSRVRKTPTKPKSNTTSMNNGIDDDDNDDGMGGTPSKKRSKQVNAELASTTPTKTGPKREKTHKSTRLLLEKTSNIPRPFTLERVIAIFRATNPHDGHFAVSSSSTANSSTLSSSSSSAKDMRKPTADRIYIEMSELERLRLVVRALSSNSGDGVGGGAGGVSSTGEHGTNTESSTAGATAILEEKWRVNVSREFVADVCRVWGLGLEGWEID